MIHDLEELFGNDIQLTEYQFPAGIPNYIRLGYQAEKLSLNQKTGILLKPLDSNWNLASLKKQWRSISEKLEIPCILMLDHLTSAQRKSLIKDHIPFIVESSQIYLPYWGISLSEQFQRAPEISQKMASGTQLTFLYLYYNYPKDGINLSKLAQCLGLSKATITRAIQDLTNRNLLQVQENWKEKIILPHMSRKEYLLKGYPSLSSPVTKTIYVKNLPENLPAKICGIKALSMNTMLASKDDDPGYAFYAKSADEIPHGLLITRQEYLDFGGTVLEKWKYNPAVLSNKQQVDDLSLLLSLDTSNDERVQIELDTIRKQYGLLTEV